METVTTDATVDEIAHVPIRVHIVPIGFEEDRVVLPALQMKAERVILISNTATLDRGDKFRKSVTTKLKKAGIDVSLVRAPIFQLEDNMKLFSGLIKANCKDRLFLNISSGSKIQALAGYISAMAAKTEGIQVVSYYVEPENYTEENPVKPISYGCKRILSLPIFPLHFPSKEIQFAITLLKEKPYSKLELAIAMARGGYIEGDLLSHDKQKPRDERARVSLQNSIDSRIVQQLLKERYATTEKKGKRVIISLTTLGEEASHLFSESKA